MRPAHSRLLAAVAATLLLAAGACRSAAREPDLLNDLAARVDRAGDLTFTAEYRIGDSASAVLAQSADPRRAAYIHPGGRAVSTETQLATCTDGADGTRCTLNPPPSPGTEPALDLLTAAAEDTGAGASTGPESVALVTPSAVLRLLSAAVLDGATVTRTENTVGGEPATCVGVHGSAGFSACITARGLLASFTGVIDGAAVIVELTSFTDSADADVFTLPSGAAIDDRRTD